MKALASRTVASGSKVTLQPEVKGSPPLHFSWRKGASPLLGSTNIALYFDNVLPSHSGDYVVTVSSYVGASLDVLTPLRVLLAPRLKLLGHDGDSVVSFQSVVGQRYWLEHTAALRESWRTMTNSYSGDNSIIVITNTFGDGVHFYRLRIE
ncbi:MAG: immunoglobulin domain-containing protein [Pedosphaera sp.]|nr:immunoglobulin domain-containing protein [Pedosphaera sp.]